MKALFSKRPRQPSEPTAEQLKQAEKAMQSAVFQTQRSKPLLQQHQVQVVLQTEKEEVLPDDPLKALLETPKEEFLSSFRINGLECMAAAYEIHHAISRSPISGALTTPLPEDVFHLMHSQICLVEDYLKAHELKNSDEGKHILVDCMRSLFQNLSYHQAQYRDTFLYNVESCMALANDFMRMIEKLDAMMDHVRKQYTYLTWSKGKGGDSISAVILQEIEHLTILFSNDAVYACHRAVNFIMSNIRTSTIPTELFSHEWEDIMVHNEVAVSIVKTYDDYLSDIANYLEHDFLYHKMVAALARETVCFYLQCLVKKAAKLRRVMKRDFGKHRSRRVRFLSSTRAIRRMTYDIQVFRDYFHTFSNESPPLHRMISEHLSVFVVLLECMWLAVGTAEETGSLEEYAIVVHKRITGANSSITRFFMSDVWLLVGQEDDHQLVEREVKMMDKELHLLSDQVKKDQLPSERTAVCEHTLQLAQVLNTMYQDRVLQEKSLACTALCREGVDIPRSTTKVAQELWKPVRHIHRRLQRLDDSDRELDRLLRSAAKTL